jgi:hypothetical protein
MKTIQAGLTLALLLFGFAEAQVIQTFNASGTWVAPNGVTSITVEAWGGGGGGAANSNQGGGAGGGGAYASAVVTAVPGTSYAITVGAAGAIAAAGSFSQFATGANVKAAGGSGANAGTAGTGGTTAASVGTTTSAGGAGGVGQTGGGTGRGGGGGGGSANSAATGGTGGNGASGVGGAGGTGAGAGGKGGNDGVVGAAGVVPGGGGGGGGAGGGASGAVGAAGRVVLTYNQILADWRMDETSWTGAANEVLDSSGNGYHGRSRRSNGSTSLATTATGSPAFTSGSQSTCGYGEFDKTSSPARTYSYVELSGLPTLPSSFTFAAWIRSTNASRSGQRILVRDDADNGWGFSLGDPGQAKIRFFNRNITNSGSVTGDGSDPGCGVFCLDSAAVITDNNWFFVAVSIDTIGKKIAHYVYNAGGALVSSTSSAFSGTWADGTGTAAIGGETVSSSEGVGTNFHFLGNIDEMQIYSGALSQSSVNALRTRARTCVAASVDHYELTVPTSSVACLTSTVTVTACTAALGSSPCTSKATTISGQTATLSTGAGSLNATTITFDATGTASTTLSFPGAADGATATVTLSGESTAATSARSCWSGSAMSTSNSCTTTFNTAGFIVANAVGGSAYAVPTQTAGTSSAANLYLRAVKTNATTQACESALTGATTVNWSAQCNNPTTCSTGSLMSLSGATSTTAGSNPIAGNANGSTASSTAVSMTFDANGNAPFSFNYTDVGQVTLYASKAASGSLLTTLSGNSNAFVVKPGGFTLSSIKCTTWDAINCAPALASPGNNPGASTASGAAFIQAGRNFSATVTATTSGGLATPNYGKETAPETVKLTATRTLPSSGGASPALTNATAFGTFSSGVATGTTFQWSEVGLITLTPSVGDADYLGVGDTAGTVSGNVGRFIPAYFTTAVTQGCSAGAFTYSGQPFSVVVTALNASALPTTNYGLISGLLNNNTVTLTNGATATSTPPWSNNTASYSTFATGTAASTLTPTYTFSSRTTAPTALTVRAKDTDGISSSGFTEGSASIRSGRIRLGNAYGSELLALPLPTYLEYYSGTGWASNTADTSCTTLGAANFAFTTSASSCATAVSSCITQLTASGSGSASALTLSKPSATGDVCITLNLDGSAAGKTCMAAVSTGSPAAPGSPVSSAAKTWLQYPWNGVTASNPSARATFGVFKSPLIYRRENY